jgi:hypothetical protein
MSILYEPKPLELPEDLPSDQIPVTTMPADN